MTCNNLLSKHRVERIWFEVFLIVIFLLSKGHNEIRVSLPGLKKQKVYEFNTTRNSCKSKTSRRIRTKKKRTRNTVENLSTTTKTKITMQQQEQ